MDEREYTGFIECYKKSSNILPIFIFTPEQIENNEYFSSNCFQFMLESLDELDKGLRGRLRGRGRLRENNRLCNVCLEKTFRFLSLQFGFQMSQQPYILRDFQ